MRVTLSPFMGFDSIEPYLRYDGKGLILLCRTSNPGGSDLQAQRLADGDRLYEHIARLAAGDVEPRRPARPGGRRHLPGRDRPRARTGADPAAADPRHRRPGRRRRPPPCAPAGAAATRRRRSSSTRRARCSMPGRGDDFAAAARARAQMARATVERRAPACAEPRIAGDSGSCRVARSGDTRACSCQRPHCRLRPLRP